MSKPPDEQLPDLALDKKAPPAARQEQRSLPPFTGLLTVVMIVIALAIGYGLYRDSHPDAVDRESAATTTGEQAR